MVWMQVIIYFLNYFFLLYQYSFAKPALLDLAGKVTVLLLNSYSSPRPTQRTDCCFLCLSAPHRHKLEYPQTRHKGVTEHPTSTVLPTAKSGSSSHSFCLWPSLKKAVTVKWDFCPKSQLGIAS